MNFEQALADLQQIVSQLEAGQGTLDESLARFERAVSLVAQCRQMLSSAEQRIEIVTGRAADGTFQSKPIDVQPTTLATDELTGDADGVTPAKRKARRATVEEPTKPRLFE